MAFQSARYLGSGSYSAQQDRQLVTEFIRTEGVLRRDDCKVKQRAAGANWSVEVDPGWVFIQGDNILFQGMYASYNDAIINVPFTTLAPVANPRVDTIVARIFDSEAGAVAPTGKPQNSVFLDIIVGAETAGATTTNLVGKAALPPTALPLSYAVIPVGATSVLTAYLTDANIRNVSNPKIYGEDNKVYRLGIDSTGQLGIEEQV